MSRHPNQTNGYNRPLGPTNPKPRTPHAAALIARSRGKTLDDVSAERKLKPPHVHRYINGACSTFAFDRVLTDEQRRLVKEMNTVMTERFDVGSDE